MIAEQITDIYLTKEKWNKNYLSKEEADKYHERLLVNGNILTYIVKGELKGYLEFYRINFEQFGRILCGINIPVFEENITDGNIALIVSMYIDPKYRNGEAWDMLSSMFLAKNRDAQFFATILANKKHQPLHVYSRADIIRLYTKGA